MSANTVIHRIVRPAVRAVAPTGIKPNAVTTARLAVGLAAAAAFAVPWPVLGGVLFLIGVLLDRADGELARQTGQSSAAGHRYDLVSDCVCAVAAFLGLGIGQFGEMGALGPMLGALAGAGIGVLFWQLNVSRIAAVRGWEPWPGVVVDPDDALALVPVLVWIGTIGPMLVAAAVITPAAALWLGLAALRQTRMERS